MDTTEAHSHSLNNREALGKSDTCACFFCFKVFSPSEITKWIDEGRTATCPDCTSDCILGSASRVPLTDEFLKEMNHRWFPKRKDRESKELAKIAIGIAEGSIFCSAQISPNEKEDIIGMVFMPLVFMRPSDNQRLISEKVAVLFEDLSEAGPTSVNGYPSFFSMKTLTSTEWRFVVNKIKEHDEMKKKLLET